jgi:hypothetical protein
VPIFSAAVDCANLPQRDGAMNTGAAAAAKYHRQGWKPVAIDRMTKKLVGQQWRLCHEP